MPEIIITDYGTELYRQSLALREEVLRKPLGLVYTPEELAQDKQITYLLYIDNGEILGVVGLQDKGEGTGQLKQMGVSDRLKGKGVGRLMVEKLEEYARSKDMFEIILEARLYAKGFYLKLGYVPYGEVYEKIGLEHVMMNKTIA